MPSPSVTELIANTIEPLDAAEDVGAEAGQQDVLLQVVFVHLALERVTQLALAERSRTAHRASRWTT